MFCFVCFVLLLFFVALFVLFGGAFHISLKYSYLCILMHFAHSCRLYRYASREGVAILPREPVTAKFISANCPFSTNLPNIIPPDILAEIMFGGLLEKGRKL